LTGLGYYSKAMTGGGVGGGGGYMNFTLSSIILFWRWLLLFYIKSFTLSIGYLLATTSQTFFYSLGEMTKDCSKKLVGDGNLKCPPLFLIFAFLLILTD
jgi:hypothetical protein